MSDAGGFVSPLRVEAPGMLDHIDFGQPPPNPAVDALGVHLASVVHGFAAGLPGPLRDEAEAVLQGYCRGRPHFIALFYRPVWSFLHWVPAADPVTLELASRVQAAALFLHLWDDHLSDGQLRPDLVRLHLRSLVWQAFLDAAHALAAVAGSTTAVVQALIDAYLLTTHRPGTADTLDAHAERMVAQVGIWRVAPFLYGMAAQGRGAALSGVVERFSVAWRLVDDVQDAAADVCSGQANALHLSLDAEDRAAWAKCHAHSVGRAGPEAESWAEVMRPIAAHGLDRTLGRANAELAAAVGLAAAQGWDGLAAEVAACRVGPVGG